MENELVLLANPEGTGALFGAVGFGGAAFIGTIYLGVGLFGKGKISFSHGSAVGAGFVVGQTWAMAGEMWAFAEGMSDGLAQGLAESFGKGGEYGPGATAIGLSLLAYGTKLRGPLAVVLGLLMPPTFTAAGGIFAIVTNLVTSGINMIAG